MLGAVLCRLHQALLLEALAAEFQQPQNLLPLGSCPQLAPGAGQARRLYTELTGLVQALAGSTEVSGPGRRPCLPYQRRPDIPEPRRGIGICGLELQNGLIVEAGTVAGRPDQPTRLQAGSAALQQLVDLGLHHGQLVPAKLALFGHLRPRQRHLFQHGCSRRDLSLLGDSERLDNQLTLVFLVDLAGEKGDTMVGRLHLTRRSKCLAGLLAPPLHEGLLGACQQRFRDALEPGPGLGVVRLQDQDLAIMSSGIVLGGHHVSALGDSQSGAGEQLLRGARLGLRLGSRRFYRLRLRLRRWRGGGHRRLGHRSDFSVGRLCRNQGGLAVSHEPRQERSHQGDHQGAADGIR